MFLRRATGSDAPDIAMPDKFALVVTLKGRPYAQPRGRHIPGHARPVSITGKAKLYATALQRAAREAVRSVGDDTVRQEFAGCALVVRALFVFPTPKLDRWAKPHVFRPDGDNLTKLLLDRLMAAGALGGDDARVAACVIRKQWGPEGWLAAQVEVLSDLKEPRVRKALGVDLSAPPAWLR